MKIGDEVTIIDTGDVWEGLKGTVEAISDKEVITKDGKDLTEITVKVFFSEDKKIMQIFPKQNLQPIETESVEDKIITEALEDVNSFIQAFAGKSVVFNGFDYTDYFQKREQDDGSFDYDEADKGEVEFYESREGKKANISGCAISDGFEPYNSTKESFESCYWDLIFEDKSILSGISGSCLTLVNPSILKESLEGTLPESNDLNEDFIHDYVYFVDIDDKEIPSWYFVSKIATAEGIDDNAVINKALELKYKIYNIEGPNFGKLIILAPKTDLQEVYADYIDYIPGKVVVNEIN